MYSFPKKLKNLTPYNPISGEYKIRLDANESFINLDKDIYKIAIDEILLNRYPDPFAKRLCKAFADFYEISSENITVGNGSDELISVIVNAFLPKKARVLTFSPDFSMYNFYSNLNECKVISLDKENLELTSDIVIDSCEKTKADCVIFSNPCNPTSLGMEYDEIIKIVENVNSLVILDEAYMDFWDQSLISVVHTYENVILLRTASKALGMAGLRLGFAVANKRLTYALRAAKSPYNVNGVSQLIAERLLLNKDILKKNLSLIVKSVEALYLSLCKRNYRFFEKIYDTKTNFIFIKTQLAKQISDFLKEKSICIRAFDGYIRITCGSEEENKALLAALDEYERTWTDEKGRNNS